MTGIGNPKGAVSIGSTIPPAIFAEIGTFTVIPTDQQNSMSSLEIRGAVHVDITRLPVVPISVKISIYVITPIARTISG